VASALPVVEGAVARACALPGSPLANAADGIDACVHCGFCLPACPTYLALEDENDSPRGRLVLMRELLDGTVSPTDPDVGRHLDQCLGCRACETACPSGVPYGALLEATRATVRQSRPTPWIGRLVLAIFARPTMLTLALAAAKVARATGLARLGARLPGTLGFGAAMLASTTRLSRLANVRSVSRPAPAPGEEPTQDVVLLRGCVMDGLQSHVHAATERALRVNACAIQSVAGQGCCGALHAHAGDLETARQLARRNIAAFETQPGATIVTNAAGCGAMLKEYAHLLHDDPAWSARAAAMSARVADVSEVLAAHGPRPAALGDTLRVTYDAPCHLQHAQRVTLPPMQVLAAIEGVTLVPLTDSDQCCGSAGIYNLIEPAVSDAVLAPKLAHLQATGAEVVVTGNPGCLMQIGAGLLREGSPMRVAHPVELLDAAYRASGLT
jgi:glycolate oxidase iron-sulfur subunit